MQTWQMLKKADAPPVVTLDPKLDEFDALHGIQCPRCAWKPDASSRWSCWNGGPEPPFQACGTSWNTFLTHGKCPGCAHQWQWTSCLRCAEWSPHEDWYHTGKP